MGKFFKDGYWDTIENICKGIGGLFLLLYCLQTRTDFFKGKKQDIPENKISCIKCGGTGNSFALFWGLIDFECSLCKGKGWKEIIRTPILTNQDILLEENKNTEYDEPIEENNIPDDPLNNYAEPSMFDNPMQTEVEPYEPAKPQTGHYEDKQSKCIECGGTGRQTKYMYSIGANGAENKEIDLHCNYCSGRGYTTERIYVLD